MEMKDNVLYFAKVRPTAIIPSITEENAGYDIYANFDQMEDVTAMVIGPFQTALVPTGVASAISNDWYLQVEERGSTGTKGIKKSAGVVDASYRGEIFIAVTNVNDKNLIITKEVDKVTITADTIKYPYSKAIAQLVLHRVHNEVPTEEITFEELQSIPSTRGTGSIGSSGK